jgi:hypothetical protein
VNFMDAFDNENRNSNNQPSGNDNPVTEGGLRAFDAAQPAPEFAPVPPGIYIARVLRGKYTTTKKGKEAYLMQFEVLEGPHTGKTIPRIWTFGAKELSYTKRDLAKFGLTTSTQLLSPFPEPGREYRVRLVVALQRGDDGVERNDIKRIEIIRVVESPVAAFILPSQAEKAEGGPK